MAKTQTKKGPTLQDRASGILLHPTSLPGSGPIGDLGPAAHRFVDFLAAAGQRWWQVLPVGPIGAGNSPYQSFSAFAGNSLLISAEALAHDGWIDPGMLRAHAGEARDKVDYEAAKEVKRQILWQAFDRFEAEPRSAAHRAFDAFCRREAVWLDDYALFSALRFHHKGKPWPQWDPAVRDRRPEALEQAREGLARDQRYHRFVQWQFVRQWESLRRYAAERGVGLIGDIPIFVSADSADVWANPELFKLRRDGTPEVVAGVPPDYFSRTGQRWGNPHYRWDLMKKNGYAWWVERLRQTFRYFDAVRIDHFIGFVRYYEIPGDAPTAEHGKYRPGPGADFFSAVFKAFKADPRNPGPGSPQFIAEDLGVVTPPVKTLRDQFNLPGMKVLQFAFGTDPEARNYQPHRYPKHAVVYTGTHDNDTTTGWFARIPAQERSFAQLYLGTHGHSIAWDMSCAAWRSTANTAIVPMQDLLGLGSEARMNLPGTPRGNWDWRMRGDALNAELARRLREMAEAYERI